MGRHRREDKKLVRQENNAQKQLVAKAPKNAKTLPTATAPKSIDDETFQWNGSSIDHEHVGDWSWELSPREIRELLTTLNELMRLTWREVHAQTYNGKGGARRVLHKSQSVESLCDTARTRLEELRVSAEMVFRLRRGTNLRIWGYLEGPTLHLLWYDKAHKVCPIDD